MPEAVKKRRLAEVIEIQNAVSKKKNKQREGKTFRVLIEGESKRSAEDWMGRIDQNITCIFPKENAQKGDYVNVFIERSTTTSLIGRIVQ